MRSAFNPRLSFFSRLPVRADWELSTQMLEREGMMPDFFEREIAAGETAAPFHFSMLAKSILGQRMRRSKRLLAASRRAELGAPIAIRWGALEPERSDPPMVLR